MAGATHYVRIDRSKTLAEEPDTGHNRWHEAIPPVVTVAPGDRVILETRDALDGFVTPSSTVEDLARGTFAPVHPLWPAGSEMDGCAPLLARLCAPAPA